ncbi:trypsin-1-like [Penaeus chinensis]|uniref:Trypsin-like serine proteinase 2 n=1 Tax=Penaeus chinensis TaxID=139456 RepID=C3W4P6_PENCE|nr:trypsin-1-like [Penaeus chinensis]ACQ45455.1 trypsin-like serine proteinase 2 [Penaeus chinensis]
MKTLVLCVLVAGAFAAPSRKPTFRRGLNKIVGGTNASPGELPYQLSFQDISFGFPFHFCGASIYNEHWAICAGHCVQGEDMNNPDYLQVVAGEHDQDVDEGNEQTVILSKIIQHEGYNGFTISNDISLLKFSQPLTFNNFVSAIDIPAQGHAASGDCIVSGWGTTSEGGNTPSVLQKVSVPIVSDAECRDAYGQNEIDDSMICAGVPEGGKDSCQGDSGGPLACSDTGSTYLAGIVSWGYGCARPNYPGVYAEVAYHVDWIKANAV